MMKYWILALVLASAACERVDPRQVLNETLLAFDNEAAAYQAILDTKFDREAFLTDLGQQEKMNQLVINWMVALRRLEARQRVAALEVKGQDLSELLKLLSD